MPGLEALHFLPCSRQRRQGKLQHASVRGIPLVSVCLLPSVDGPRARPWLKSSHVSVELSLGERMLETMLCFSSDCDGQHFSVHC